ncbi:TetR/AcrR family transcriptional regulator [Natronospira bacteriovora]|uniref:TetR/AcrR family transcriptional regulator n=1 Tax=Natronospira bacteriovora TaxID=3069753 RepID=A0ABU0WBE5_9GAMM|nr:TetR/AcrR family transcriptional regulator [Natronospira sp. AB-CW4]MDQ2070260.1 TetR/AcrR family transcriptional regulator [Natronospira sp. AB-CW4]
MASAPLSRDSILDAALAVAADRHWEAVRLFDVAEQLGVTLADLQPLLAEKEQLVDWLWQRADETLLADCRGKSFQTLDFPKQFEACVLAWLGALQPARRTFRQMLEVRMEPGHLHIQIPTLFQVSRSVQWMRELCGRDATFLRRASEETALTAVFVSTLLVWLGDDSHGSQRSRDWCRDRLAQAIALGRWWPRRPPSTGQ